MRWTEWLQETRLMRFEEAYSGWTESRPTQEEAALLLGVCARTFRRYIDRYLSEFQSRFNRRFDLSELIPKQERGNKG